MTDRARRPSAIQKELQQQLPIASTRQEAFLGLLRTASVVRRPVNRVLEAHDLSMAAYNVLRILRGAGDAGLPTLAIRERMIEEAAGITRLVDRLEVDGLVVRARGSSEDRRQIYCRITTAGIDLLETLNPLVELAVEGSLAVLTEPELQRLIQLLDQLRSRSPRGGLVQTRREVRGDAAGE